MPLELLDLSSRKRIVKSLCLRGKTTLLMNPMVIPLRLICLSNTHSDIENKIQRTGLPIGLYVTAAAKDIMGNTVILMENKLIDYTSQGKLIIRRRRNNDLRRINSVARAALGILIISPYQLQQFVVDIDDCATCYEIDGRGKFRSSI